MLGFEAAKQVVTLGRSAFFPADAPDLPTGRSPLVREDDLLPQFGYVGKEYPARRILLLGINPGNGSDDRRSAADGRMMPALRRFRVDPTHENYRDAALAYRRECETWPQWRRSCSELMGVGKLTFDDIAYTNCLPWRTESESGFSELVASKTAQFYVRPLIEDLNPSVIVALGKSRVPAILGMTGLARPR